MPLLKLALLDPDTVPEKGRFDSLVAPGDPVVKSYTFGSRQDVIDWLVANDWPDEHPWVLEGSTLHDPETVLSWLPD